MNSNALPHSTSNTPAAPHPYSLDACSSISKSLMNSPMNVLKLVEIKSGLKWHMYRGRTLASDLPSHNEVLKSFNNCLTAGLACCYHAFQFQAMNGPIQNSTRLLVYTFNQDHIDLTSKVDPKLIWIGTGEGDDGLTEEVKKYLDLAIQNLIERMLHSDGYITLGAWFARPDCPTSNCSLSLYRFNYFNQDSTYWVCASVSVREAPIQLRLLSREELDNCEKMLKGRKVVLSPCGVSGQLTGRSFHSDTAEGSFEILPDWKLVYPNMFLCPVLPPLLEVLIAGVCMKYPTQFILSYAREQSAPSKKQINCENSHPPISVKELIDPVYCMDLLQTGSNEFVSWNRLYMRQASVSSPMTDRLSSRADTPCFLSSQDRRASLASNAPLALMTSSEGVEHTSVASTPVAGLMEGTGFPDRNGPRQHVPPHTLKIFRDDSKPEDRSNWLSTTEAKPLSHRTKSSLDINRVWECYTLPESSVSLENLYSSHPCVLEYGDSGVSNSGIIHGVIMGGYGGARGGANGRQTGRARRTRARTRSEKGSTSKAVTNRKKRASRTDSKKQQTPTGREERTTPALLSLSDREMPPPSSGQITPALTPVTPNNSQTNGSAFIIPPQDIPPNSEPMDMRTPFLDVLVATPTAINAPFILPEPTSSTFTQSLSTSSPTTPQHSQPLSQHKQAVPLPHTLGSIKMPEQIFEWEDEDPVSMEQTHSLEQNLHDSECSKKGSLYYKNTHLGLEESHHGHNFPTPPSAGNNVHSPSNKKSNPVNSEAKEEISQITEFIPDSYKPFFELKTLGKSDHREYQLSPHESPHNIYKPRATLSRDASQLNEATPENRGSFVEAGLTENNLPSTPSTFVTQLSKPTSECQSVKKEFSESDVMLPPGVERSVSVNDPEPQTNNPEAHALLFNFMLLDPQQILAEPPPITPFVPPVSAHSSQPNHFTFPASQFPAQDDLVFDLDAFLNFGASRDNSIPTLSFSNEHLNGNFVQGYLASYNMRLSSQFAPTGYTSVSNKQPLKPTNFKQKCLDPNAPDPVSFTLPTTHDPILKDVLELIQRQCLSTIAPLAPLAHPLEHTLSSKGVIDLYDRPLLTSKLRESCRFYAENLEEVETAMDVGTGTQSDMKESSPTSPSMMEETSQTETGGDISQPLESDDSQQEEDEGVTVHIDYSLDIDNDGSWFSSTQQRSDQKTSKLIRKIQTSLPKSMLRARAISPLTWNELFQVLATAQTTDSQHIPTNVPAPLPIPSLLVGQEADWVEVAPYDISSWDKLSLSPYASKEDVSYLVVSPAGEKIESRVQHYFKQLSAIYQDSELGRHRPIPNTKTRADGLYTFSPISPTYLELDTLSAIKNLFTQIFAELTAIPWSQRKHPKTTEDPTSSAQSCNVTSEGEGPPGLVVYFLNIGPAHQQIDIMKVLAEALSDCPLDADLAKRLILSVIPAKEVITQRRISSQTLRTICLDVFSKCRYFHKPWLPNRGMNFAENCDDWRAMLYQDKEQPTSKSMVTVWMYRPPYILAKAIDMRPETLPPSKKSVPSSSLNESSLLNFQLGEKAPNTLFCGYCVSPGSCYLLAVCCDSQGSLLNSAIFGLKYPGKVDQFRAKEEALRDLWTYILSIISQTVLSWHVVITRLGRPSNEELHDLNRVVRDLDKVQLDLTRSCVSCGCKCNTHAPSVLSVHVLSFLPEKNFRVFLNGDSYPHTYTQGHSVTYILVQPGPNSTDTYAGDFDPLSAIDHLDNMEFPGQLQSTEDDMNEMSILGDIFRIDDIRISAPDSVDNYHAVGYLLSSASPGPLPDAFWGESKQRNAFFRAQLHKQIYLDSNAKHPSYEETMKKILEQFDALSWLILDPEHEGRVCSLPLHLYTLCNLYHLMRWLSLKPI